MRKVAEETVTYPAARVYCEFHESAAPDVEGYGEVVAEETVDYELFTYTATLTHERCGGGTFTTESPRYEVRERGAGTFEEGYVARYEGLTPMSVVAEFPALAHHVFERFPHMREEAMKTFPATMRAGLPSSASLGYAVA